MTIKFNGLTAASAFAASDILAMSLAGASGSRKLTFTQLFGDAFAAVGQLKFPASQSSSADANTLDDYEEGTWTPVLTFGTPGNLSVAYTIQVAEYIKIGRAVLVNFHIETSTFTHTTASGHCIISGLPFTAKNTSDYYWPGAVLFQGVTKATYTNFICSVVFNTTNFFFQASGSGVAGVNVTTADMPTGVTQIIRSAAHYSATA